MNLIVAIAIVILFCATSCFGLGRLQKRFTVNSTPFWITGVVLTVGTFFVFTVVFGILFYLTDAVALGGQGNLKVIHAPVFAALPTAIIGAIYFIGIVLRLVKPGFGENSS